MTNPQLKGLHFLAPEIVQTSAMDCGPAALKALLEGFSIPVSYGRLREACQTDVDGTSINILEDVANQLGLEVEQVVAPLDHILLPEEPIAPAIVVVRQPNGLTHFVVIWRLHGGRFVQVMDPARGRRWVSRQRFLDEVYIHRMPFPADVWREWAGEAGFCNPLRWRLARLNLDQTLLDQLLTIAQDDPCWRSLAALDATTRMVTAIVAAGGLASGAEAGSVLERLFERARRPPPSDSCSYSYGEDSVVPAAYWLVQPLSAEAGFSEATGQLLFQGAVLLQVFGTRPAPTNSDERAAKDLDPDKKVSAEAVLSTESIEEPAPPRPLSPELVAALAEKADRPELELLRLLRQDGLLAPLVLIAALCLAAVGVIIEAVLLGSLIDIGQSLNFSGQIVTVIASLFILVGLLFALEIPLTTMILQLGRRLELRWRLAFLAKIPRLDDPYFHSRLTSDMARRAYELYKLRRLPLLGFNFLHLSFQLFWTVAGIAWLDLSSAPLALLAAVLALTLPLAAQPLLAEFDQRLQAHAGGLSLFYLDALLGLTPLRAHSAARSMRREHETRLVAWARANLTFYHAICSVEGLTAGINTGLASLIVLAYISRGGEAGVVLLLTYWSLNIVFVGKTLANLARQYPRQRNRILGLLEPLNAPEIGDIPAASPVESPASEASDPSESEPDQSGVAILMKNVQVHAGGHTILDQLNLSLKAGEHVAIVGPSGAGKSSLVGLLLGWFRPANGHIQVDGRPLTGPRIQVLRQETVWVDPAVQLWNRTFLQNLRYGTGPTTSSAAINTVIKQANLADVLKRLATGMQTPLGEGGKLVSGGEGQRVRLGRGMMRTRVRLVILDEPFRGLDRDQRRELLAHARQYWPAATLLCITHDVSQTIEFDRVLVVEAGRIIEDGSPAALAAQPDSRYQTLLAGEETVRTELWASAEWRRFQLDRGQLREKTAP